MMKNIFKNIPGLDGCRWGPGDWYDKHRRALAEAIAGNEDFTTDWYACKKEILSAKVTRKEWKYTCEVSVLDDFDTQGNGAVEFELALEGDPALDAIEEKLNEAWELADEDRKENAVYCGYSIGHLNEEGQRRDWVWTYIKPIGDAVMYDFPEPPGDNYFEWGWEYGGINLEKDALTDEEKEKIEEWIFDDTGKGITTIGQWIVEAWDHSDARFDD